MTHDEVTAAMKAEDVPVEWVEIALVTHVAPGYTIAPVEAGTALNYIRDDLRAALAAVAPVIQAQALRDAADRLHARTDGVNREGTKGWPERHREVYAHAIDEASDALREDAARLTDTTEWPAT